MTAGTAGGFVMVRRHLGWRTKYRTKTRAFRTPIRVFGARNQGL